MDNLFYEDITEPGVAGTFTPASLGDLVLWLDSRDPTSPVATWPDRSGNGYDAVQSVAARKPTTGSATSPTGLPLVSFDGSPVVGQEDYLDGVIPNSDYPSVAQGWTFFFAGNLKVCRKAAASNSACLFKTQGAGPRLMYEDFSFTHKYAFNDSLSEKQYSAFSAGNQTLSYVWSAGSGGPPTYTGTVKCYVNGTSLGSKSYSMNTSAVSDYRLGDSIPDGQPAYADLACVLWYRRALSDSHRIRVQRWIERTFGYG